MDKSTYKYLIEKIFVEYLTIYMLRDISKLQIRKVKEKGYFFFTDKNERILSQPIVMKMTIIIDST